MSCIIKSTCKVSGDVNWRRNSGFWNISLSWVFDSIRLRAFGLKLSNCGQGEITKRPNARIPPSRKEQKKFNVGSSRTLLYLVHCRVCLHHLRHCGVLQLRKEASGEPPSMLPRSADPNPPRPPAAPDLWLSARPPSKLLKSGEPNPPRLPMAPVLALLVGPDRAAPCAPPAGDFSRQTKYSTCQHQYKNPLIKYRHPKLNKVWLNHNSQQNIQTNTSYNHILRLSYNIK